MEQARAYLKGLMGDGILSPEEIIDIAAGLTECQR